MCIRESQFHSLSLASKKYEIAYSYHYRKQLLCRVSEAFGKAWKTLGELYIGNNFFAEYFLSDTRQRLSRVPLGTWQKSRHHDARWRQRPPLCWVPSVKALGKEAPVGPFASSFADCIRRHSTKTLSLPSASWTSSQQRDHQRAPLSVPLPSALVLGACSQMLWIKNKATQNVKCQNPSSFEALFP
jgi:hypothetical protein